MTLDHKGPFTKNELINHLLAGHPVHRVIELERENTHLRSQVRIALGNQLPADSGNQIDVDVEQLPHTIRIRYPLPLGPHRVEAVRVYFERSGFVPVLSYFEVTGKDGVVVEADLDGDHHPWICQISDVGGT
jgi:hypothetical protein